MLASRLSVFLKTGYLIRNASTSNGAKPLRMGKKRSSIPERKSHFVDYHLLTAVGGKGGDGCVAFLQIWKNPNAGPSGGDGGNGGHVILEANTNMKSLNHLTTVVKAENGRNGVGKNMHGANGKHEVIMVPLGTQVKKDGASECIISLDDPGEQFIAARGGAGGHGNSFYLSNENRHPEIAEMGSLGETVKYILELKIMAHVGLVGFPNAGKSTFLRAISRARPKVASYPFTTLNPHVGIVHYDDYVQLAVADLPGLIPGAHMNRGLGLSFLKHIERCLFILFVIDLSHDDPCGQLECLQYELEQYKEGLSKRPHAIVANKYDLPEAQANLQILQTNVDIPIFPVSAKYGNEVRTLLNYMKSMYEEHNKENLVW